MDKISKQIIFPLIALGCGVLIYFGLVSLKKPPEEKPEEIIPTAVTIEPLVVESINIQVASHGNVEPKYSTNVVAEVNGKIVFLADSFQRGGFVKKGELIASVDPFDYETLLIEAEANLASASASLELEKAQGKVAEEEWKNIQHTKPSELGLRKPQLAQEKARVKAAQASLQRAQENLKRTQIYAPFDALIKSRSVSVGSFVNIGTPVGTLLSTDIAEIRLPIARNNMYFLNDSGINSKVLLTSTDGNYQWLASIVREEGILDEMNRMVFLVAHVNEPYSLQPPLRFGSYVAATIDGRQIADASIVPRHLINDNRIAIMNQTTKELNFKSINIVQDQDKQVIVTGELDHGDWLITSPLQIPVEGMPLSTTEDSPISQIQVETQ